MAATKKSTKRVTKRAAKKPKRKPPATIKPECRELRETLGYLKALRKRLEKSTLWQDYYHIDSLLDKFQTLYDLAKKGKVSVKWENENGDYDYYDDDY